MFDWSWMGSEGAVLTLFGSEYFLTYNEIRVIGIIVAFAAVFVGASAVRRVLDRVWPDRPDWIR